MTGFKDNSYYIYRPSLKRAIGCFEKRKDAEDNFEEGDVLLLVLPCKAKTVCKKAIIDFNKKQLTIEGVFKEYRSGTYEIPDSMLSTILKDIYDVCKEVTIIGTPKIEGECLDEVLYM